MKWTWLFQKPATTLFPVQSMTRASAGIWTSLRLPIAVMTPLDARTTASEIGPFPVRAVKWSAAYLRFLWGCLANRFDIAHINLAWRGSTWRKIVYIQTAALFGKKTVLHLHGSGYDRFYASVSPRKQAAIRGAFARADRVVVLSEYWRKFVVDTLGTNPDKVIKIRLEHETAP